MLTRIFPDMLDNRFRGHVLALWLFVPLLALEAIMGGNSILNARDIAMHADGIPLDSYSTAAAAAVVSLFALLGFCRLLFAALGLLVLIRYRAAVGLMYLLFLIVHLGSKVLTTIHPIARAGGGSGNMGTIIVWSLTGAFALGLLLSLIGKPSRSQANGPPE